jgi:hypothetical protein
MLRSRLGRFTRSLGNRSNDTFSRNCCWGIFLSERELGVEGFGVWMGDPYVSGCIISQEHSVLDIHLHIKQEKVADYRCQINLMHSRCLPVYLQYKACVILRPKPLPHLKSAT